jgi:hypothetical protein
MIIMIMTVLIIIAATPVVAAMAVTTTDRARPHPIAAEAYPSRAFLPGSCNPC